MERLRLRRLIRLRRDGLGYTLVEVIVAMLISCIMVTAMFSVALTQKAGSGKSDRKMLANQGMSQVSAMLKGYVTGCGCDPNTGVCNGGGDCDTLLGPNKANGGVATWYLNGSGGNISDSMGNVYALTYGVHTLTGVLPGWLEAAPYNARVSYTVSQAQLVNGRPVPQVVMSVNWTEP